MSEGNGPTRAVGALGLGDVPDDEAPAPQREAAPSGRRDRARQVGVVAHGTAEADAAWPAGREWSRARRWTGPRAAALVAAALDAVGDRAWDPTRSAVLVVIGFAEADGVEAELAALAAAHPDVTVGDVAALLHEEVSDFAYLRGLPSLLGQHVARALGGAASSCAVPEDAAPGDPEGGLAQALGVARRMVASGETDQVLVVHPTPDGAEALLIGPEGSSPPDDQPLVIAGVGAVTALGPTFDATWEGLREGRSGIGPVGWTDGVPMAPAVAAVPASHRAELRRTWSERLGHTAAWNETLAHEVAAQALVGVEPMRLGLVWAPMWAGPGGPMPDEWARWFADLAAGADAPDAGGREDDLPGTRAGVPAAARPPSTDAGFGVRALAADLARMTGHDVYPLSVEATCAGGLRALAEAARMVRSGCVDAALAVGVVARNNPYVVSQFAQLTALSRYAGDPALASRPFDAGRAGMVMAEAAAAVLVRRAQPGKAGVRLLGTGVALGTAHPTAPAAVDVAAAVTRALDAAGLAARDIGTVNAHGTGTRLNDEVEAQALRGLLGDAVGRTPVAACKALTGHASAASGLLEVAVLARTLATGIIPGVPTCTDPDPALGLDVAVGPRATSARVGLTTSFGFGGQYAAALLAAPSPSPAPAPHP